MPGRTEEASQRDSPSVMIDGDKTALDCNRDRFCSVFNAEFIKTVNDMVADGLVTDMQ